jgi:hypothetical protein
MRLDIQEASIVPISLKFSVRQTLKLSGLSPVFRGVKDLLGIRQGALIARFLGDTSTMTVWISNCSARVDYSSPHVRQNEMNRTCIVGR